MRHTKWVNCFQLKPNQEITGHKDNSSTRYFSATVVSVNENSIDILMWGETPETISNKGLFEVEMSREEFCAKYKAKAEQLVIAIQNEMYADECGYHEMDNSWLEYDFYELACTLEQRKATLLGYFKLSYPKISWLSETELDIGVVIEEQSERYWCHASSKTINTMIKRYKRLKELQNES